LHSNHCVSGLILLIDDNANEELPFNTDLLFDEPPNQYQLRELNHLHNDYCAKKWNGEIDDLIKTPVR
jgi:ATP-dependent DNA helicase DinG